ncbi:hypothetical protein ACTJI2_15570 [Pseudoxanthomonas sp. 22568]|uniref:hypothetical protein n=1 Tax=Pseudoxanthomonas sp. 22568 TaxID=3453945 RepID=UPI003F829A8D
MTRSSPVWLPIGFAIALIGIGFKYWQLPADQAVLPAALYTPGLAAVAVVAMLLRAFGTGRFLRVWLWAALAVPTAVVLRHLLAGDAAMVPWPRELWIATMLGLGASLIGTVIGSLLLLRSSRRPQ